MLKDIRFVGLALRDLFFPRRCAVCDVALEADEKFLCFDCFSKLPLTHFWEWRDNPAEERLLHLCGIGKAASLYFYRKEGGYSHLVQKVKYEGQVRLGMRLGELLGSYMKECGQFGDVQAVVPVPLHPLRRLSRGYNQAEMAARGIAAGLGGLKVETRLLARTKYTRTQTKLGAEGKKENVKNAFRIRPRVARRLEREGIKNILLVDDVLTSGATLASAAGCLMPRFNVDAATLGFVE